MKIKQSPDDFQVEELTDVTPSAGDFALYRLEKIGWTTEDALAVIRRRWRIPAERLSYGGMKDRHARTSQHLTILRGPRRGLSQQGIRLVYLGQTQNEFSSSDIRANRFHITVRSVANAAAANAETALAEFPADGLPNYFDDQRFGSVAGTRGEFVAQHLLRGNYEQGLKLALTGRYEHDRAAVRQEKAILQAHWGDWPACKHQLPRGHVRSLVDYLVSHPADFRGAFARMRGDLASLYLSAYQSHLWNRLLAKWIERRFAQEQRLALSLKLGDLPAARRLDVETRSELASLALPLPSARLHYEDALPSAPADWADAMRSVMTEEGIELAHLRLPGLRRPFFSRGERRMWFWPDALTAGVHPDERHPGRRKLVLSFDLPRGSYATLVIKRVTQAPAFPAEE